MKVYATDLEKELIGLKGRINKRLKFLIKETNHCLWNEVKHLDPEEKLLIMKQIEKKYVAQSKQLNMFQDDNSAPKLNKYVNS